MESFISILENILGWFNEATGLSSFITAICAIFAIVISTKANKVAKEAKKIAEDERTERKAREAAEEEKRNKETIEKVKMAVPKLFLAQDTFCWGEYTFKPGAMNEFGKPKDIPGRSVTIRKPGMIRNGDVIDPIPCCIYNASEYNSDSGDVQFFSQFFGDLSLKNLSISEIITQIRIIKSVFHMHEFNKEELAKYENFRDKLPTSLSKEIVFYPPSDEKPLNVYIRPQGEPDGINSSKGESNQLDSHAHDFHMLIGYLCNFDENCLVNPYYLTGDLESIKQDALLKKKNKSKQIDCDLDVIIDMYDSVELEIEITTHSEKKYLETIRSEITRTKGESGRYKTYSSYPILIE